MCKALASREIDVGMLLTEGAIKFALENPEAFHVLGVYVESPLNWGIHAGASSTIENLKDENSESVRFAISRLGSGSHLMASILAKNLGWDFSSLKFQVVGTIHGAEKALVEKGDLIFLWEKGMTQPLVDKKIFKSLGVLPTPWPCFLICVAPEVWKTRRSEIESVLSLVKSECEAFKRNESDSIGAVVQNFGLRPETAKEWFRHVAFAKDFRNVSSAADAADAARIGLQSVGLLEAKWTKKDVMQRCVPREGMTSKL